MKPGAEPPYDTNDYVSGRSSMFPQDYYQDMDKLLEEAAWVRSKITANDKIGPTGNLYSKMNSDGTFEIQMFIDGNNTNDMFSNIPSIFPKIP